MNIAARGLGVSRKKSRRGGEEKTEKIAGGGVLGQEESTVGRNEIAGRPGKTAHGSLLSGGGNTVCPAPRLSGNVGEDGRAEADAGRRCDGPGDPGILGMGLEASAILADVERVEEGILIAIGALERAIDRLAITRQMALDTMEE